MSSGRPEALPLQGVQGRLFGLRQRKAQLWLHDLLVVLQAALCALEAAPTRALTALAQRLDVAEADVAAMIVPTAAPSQRLPSLV